MILAAIITQHEKDNLMKEYKIEEKINISNRITFTAKILISAAATLVIGTFLFKFSRSWTILELFPATVEQGLILGNIIWLTALKITGLVAILTSAGSLITGKWKPSIAKSNLQ